MPFVLALALLLAPSRATADREAYSSRPSAADAAIAAARDASLSGAARTRRDRQYLAMLRFDAQVVGFNPGAEIFFLGRDGEFFHDAAMLLHRDEPDVRKRLHLLNISRPIYGDAAQEALLVDYLAQSGVVDALRAGKTIVFADTGWRGLLTQHLARLLKRHFKEKGWPDPGLEIGKKIRTQFVLAGKDSGASSSRTFLYTTAPDGDNHDPRFKHFANRQRVVSYENDTPHFTRTADRLERDGKTGRVEAMSEAMSEEDRAEARKYLSDLKSSFLADSMRDEYRRELGTHAARVAALERLHELRARMEARVDGSSYRREDIAEYREAAKALLDAVTAAAQDDALAEARKRDFAEFTARNLRLPEGWRFTDDSSLGEHRTQRAMLKRIEEVFSTEFRPGADEKDARDLKRIEGLLAEAEKLDGLAQRDAFKRARTAAFKKSITRDRYLLHFATTASDPEATNLVERLTELWNFDGPWSQDAQNALLDLASRGEGTAQRCAERILGRIVMDSSVLRDAIALLAHPDEVPDAERARLVDVLRRQLTQNKKTERFREVLSRFPSTDPRAAEIVRGLYAWTQGGWPESWRARQKAIGARSELEVPEWYVDALEKVRSGTVRSFFSWSDEYIHYFKSLERMGFRLGDFHAHDHDEIRRWMPEFAEGREIDVEALKAECHRRQKAGERNVWARAASDCRDAFKRTE